MIDEIAIVDDVSVNAMSELLKQEPFNMHDEREAELVVRLLVIAGSISC